MRTLVILGVLAALGEVAQAKQFSHERFDAVLKQFVDSRGLVDYAALKKRPRDLDDYVRLLAASSPENAPALFPSKNHELAYWINAYNALILREVVGRYPEIHSIKELAKWFLGDAFDKENVVGGKELSFNHIEHQILRPRFGEPRIHFMINCASLSCAPLPREAATAENLERLLQQQAQRFFRLPWNARVDRQENQVYLSKYFDWFPEDFTGWYGKKFGKSKATVVDYVKLFLPDQDRRYLDAHGDAEVEFVSYDWSLNDTKNPKAARMWGQVDRASR
ncbi:MAG: DUF547 domain-containing protein [Acidobacteria bacterium]|nr:DUF547 domain-containing protein [Acidobacteriota bacterium]